MNTQTTDEEAIRALYHNLLASWNRRSAEDYAALIEEDGHIVGFDGSMMNGRTEVEASLRQIFADHQTNPYLGIVRSVRFLTPEVAILRAVSGMVAPGQADILPAVNTIQTLVAVRHGEGWQVALFQNTPAQFHGRPELSQALSEELRRLL